MESAAVIERVRKNRMWVEKGVPDFIIVIPGEISIDYKPKVLFIELKEKSYHTGKASAVTQEQKAWLLALTEIERIEAKLCIGHQQAITWILDNLSIESKVHLHKNRYITIVEDREWILGLMEQISHTSGERETSKPETTERRR